MGADRLGRVRQVLVVSGLLPEAASLDPRHVSTLSGGVDADTYLVRVPGCVESVVKLNEHTLEAEAAALRAWRAHTPRVPRVLGAGTAPWSPTVKFLVLEAMVDDEGEVVETAEEYLRRLPDGARDVGRALGAELWLLHQARAGATFGNFADTPGAERTYRSWTAYLHDYLVQHLDYLREVGVPEHRAEKVRSFIDGCPQDGVARHLHGDVTIRNVAMLGHTPPRIGLFDPNPIHGDPSWDMAAMANNVEYGERRERIDGGRSETLTRDRALLAGFWETYPSVVSDRLLLAAQLLQAVLQGEHREAAAADGRFDVQDVEVGRQHVRSLVDRMST